MPIRSAFSAPMITLIDVDAAVAELRRVLDADARIVCIKGGPAHTPSGFISPADTRFDPFWGLVNESGVTVGIHSGDAGYGRYLNDWEPSGDFESFRFSPLRTVLSSDRPPFETMAAFLCQGLFDRFPRVRVASIEAGELGVHPHKKLKKAYSQMPGSFRSDPIENLRQHIWIAPFYEDNLAQLKESTLARSRSCLVRIGRTPKVWPNHATSRWISDDMDSAEDEIHTVMAENGWTLHVPVQLSCHRSTRAEWSVQEPAGGVLKDPGLSVVASRPRRPGIFHEPGPSPRVYGTRASRRRCI